MMRREAPRNYETSHNIAQLPMLNPNCNPARTSILGKGKGRNSDQ